MNRRGSSAIAPDVKVSVSQINGLVEDLDEFLAPLKGFWGERSEPRETAHDKISWRAANGGDEHFSRLWTGFTESAPLELEIR